MKKNKEMVNTFLDSVISVKREGDRFGERHAGDLKANGNYSSIRW